MCLCQDEESHWYCENNRTRLVKYKFIKEPIDHYILILNFNTVKKIGKK
jgi:hypothetical protein